MHSALDFRFGTSYIPLSDEKKAEFRVMFEDLQVVIIDEMSMVSSDSLYHIHKRMKDILGFPDDLFGGRAIVMLGDLMQLKPVKGSEIYGKPKSPHNKALYNSTDSIWAKMEVVTLSTNFRQGKVSEFTECLNLIRTMQPNEELPANFVSLLKSRRLKKEKVWTLQNDAIHAFYTNAEVEKHNTTKLNLLKTKLVKAKAQIFGHKPPISGMKKNYIFQFSTCLS